MSSKNNKSVQKKKQVDMDEKANKEEMNTRDMI
jgi:hypothetical protein